MNLPFQIAKRYLLAKKSHSAINLISLVSLAGVTIGTMALVVVLSVFNGFSGLLESLYNSFDPQLKIMPVSGKVFDGSDKNLISVLATTPGVAAFCATLQGQVLIKYDEKTTPAILKGVGSKYSEVTNIDSILYEGSFVLTEGDYRYGIPGYGLAKTLGSGIKFVKPFEIFAPKRIGNIPLNDPTSGFNSEILYPSAIFLVRQPEYDENYMLADIDIARNLFGYTNEVTAIEIRLKADADEAKTKDELQEKIGKSYVVKNRHEQKESFYRMMQIEKWMTFLILSFILLIAIFNIIGSLSMLIIDKTADAITLKNMGADRKFIRQIFLTEGWLISGIGCLSGIAAGVIISLIQKWFGFVKLGTGTFIVDAYPVHVQFSDLVYIFITVAIMGFFASWYPSAYIARKLTE